MLSTAVTTSRHIEPACIRLPFGVGDFRPLSDCSGPKPKRVPCFVRGCEHEVEVPGYRVRGKACPVHGIRSHVSSAGVTYTYTDPRRNIIASPELFRRRVIRHPFKYESHRFGYERSEDALSWNVFRSLYEAGLLGRLGEFLTGIASTIQPRLYLWGLEITNDAFDPWPLLIAARQRFEGNLPVKRPLTEPDIALHLPSRYLILIEAKFTSPNTLYERGRRKDNSSLTLNELLGIYHDRSLKLLDQQRAATAQRVHYQLWRNTVFSEWMAQFDHPQTKAFHVNLVRDGYEQDSAAEFHELVAEPYKDRFQRLTWETIHRLVAGEPRVRLMRRYLETKTAGLRPAFNLRGSVR